MLAAYHNGDYMAVTSYPVSFGGAPSAILDRNGIEDPYFGTGSSNAGFGMKKEVLDVMETWVDAAIEVTATWENEAKNFRRILQSLRCACVSSSGWYLYQGIEDGRWLYTCLQSGSLMKCL